MDKAPQMNLAQYAKLNGGVTQADIQSHIHAGLRSLPVNKWTWYYRELERLQREAQKTLEAYSADVRANKIRLPDKLTIEDIANGQDGNPCVEAARRILAKKAARAKNAHTESQNNV